MKVTRKKIENIIKEEVNNVLKEILGGVELVIGDTAKKIKKMYLDQGVDRARANALAIAYVELSFIFESEKLRDALSMIKQSRTVGTRDAIARILKPIAKSAAVGLGSIAFAGFRGGEVSITTSGAASIPPERAVSKLQFHIRRMMSGAAALADAIEEGKSNIVSAKTRAFANDAAATFALCEQAGYPGCEGLSDFFKQKVQAFSTNPPASPLVDKQSLGEV